MLREFKFLGRYSSKNSEIEERENLPTNPKESLVTLTHTSIDPTRAPLHSIPEPIHNSKILSEPDISVKNKKISRTPVKDKGKISDSVIPLRTPEKHGLSSKNRFGWAHKNELPDETNTSKGVGGFTNTTTPKSTRTMGKANSTYSECNSTLSTPTKSVSKPASSALFLPSGSRPPMNGVGYRTGNYATMSKGLPITCNSSTVVNTVEVPHFALKEDPSFWMEHNVQVVIRVRPLNNSERSVNGYNRCLKQESAQCITWIGYPETRFTFDHVACEAVDQETLFRMVGLPMVENCLSGYHSCVFAYGQTGSGKTYTMLGEMDELEVRPSQNRGMTARMFEFLFARIRAEEEIRRDERLKYSCRCSFLEIYNEQITDLLEPSATNLQLREDTKNGVYVENLSEFEVGTVGDILKLLSQGSSNRKVATTNMNRESSRSHSVFTCIIESSWEKDATINSRFARMNLVDLAGSERQKSSGAEGERLKEAAGINKSLSTLGHVIMMLVDIAQGKPRHVPYRDSRLTFLLQDSLGGNSKTMIIANVSPSICCAAESLNTLKFAQRAKLIQNNAVVNEDSSGDVTALQNQIRQLKEELNSLKRQNVSRTLSFCSKPPGDITYEPENFCDTKAIEMDQQQEHNNPETEPNGSLKLSSKQMKSFETTLAGALRREQMGEISTKKLEAQIEQLNRLVRQREEYAQCTHMMLKLREEKIQRMESLVGGLIPTDSYLVEENSALSAEIKLLQTKVDKNPEVTRFAMEYDRVLEQVRRYQDFYEEGEREMLLAEVSELRNQLVHLLDGNSKQHKRSKIDISDQEALRNCRENDTLQSELNKALSELEECRTNLSSCLERNEKLTRELEDLRATVNNLNAPHDHDSGIEVIKESIMEAPTLGDQPLGTICEDSSQMTYDNLMKPAKDIMNLELEVDILKQMLKEERSSRATIEGNEFSLDQDFHDTKEKLSSTTRKYEEVNEELKEAKSVIQALESQQLFLINELEDLKNCDSRFSELINKRDTEISTLKEQIYCRELRDPPPHNDSNDKDSSLVMRLKKMQNSLEMAKELNMRYQSDHAIHESNEEEMDKIRKQVEAETAEVIICLQDELVDLQIQVQDSNLKDTHSEQKIVSLDQDNKRLSEKLQENEKELKAFSERWELLSREIEIVLADGNEALEDAFDQVEFSSGSSLQSENRVSDQVERIKKIITEKEMSIHELNRCLEDAHNRTSDLEGKLRSLKGATMVITEARQQECNTIQREMLALHDQLHSKASVIEELQNEIRLGKEQLEKTATSATIAFVIVNRLYELNSTSFDALAEKDESIYNLGFKINGAETLIQSLTRELDISREGSEKLRLQLSIEQQRACAMERKLLEIEQSEILETSEKLAELKTGVSTLRSSMDIYANNKDAMISNQDKSEAQTSGETNSGKNTIESCALGQDMETKISGSSDKDLACHDVDRDVSNRDATIILLRKEIESALESLKAVQCEMAKLRKEKEEVIMHERRSQESTKSVVTKLASLQQAMSNFEKQIGSNMGILDHKLLAVEDTVQEICNFRCQEKELLEAELGDAKAVAVQRSAEASCILAKYEEAQDFVREADIVINELMIANETMKLEIKGIKKKEATLTEEKGVLFGQVQSLQSTIEMKHLHCENLEKQSASDFLEMKNLVSDLEYVIAEVIGNSNKEFKSLTDDFLSMKSLLQDSTKSIRSWVEEIWSEIVIKDCAFSVLHLCHMGLLLESVTGLNTENVLLNRGLSESNSVINELKEYNFRSRTEMEMCRVLKGKLLADMKKGFDRISKKEDEAGELTAKLAGFQKKILDLQGQEELMLERADHMGFELSTLMKELDRSNGNILKSMQENENMLLNREEALEALEDNYMIDLCAKDFELLILASHFQRETLGFCENLEKMKRHVIFSTIDAELKERNLLDKKDEIALLTKEIEEKKKVGLDLISKLTERNSTIEHMVKLKEALETDVQLLKNSALSNDTLNSQLGEVMKAKTSLLSQVQNLELENHKLQEEVIAKEMELKEVTTHTSAIDIKKKALQDELLLHITTLNKVQNELKEKDEELRIMSCLETEKQSVETESRKLKENYCSVFHDMEVKNSELMLNINQCVDELENLNVVGSNISNALNGDKFQQISEALQMADKFVKELEILENSVTEILTENLSLQTELIRKDDVSNGLLFDLRLLQESASSNKDQKDEIEELVASLEDLEDELAKRTREHDEAVENSHIVEAQLEEKTGIISSLRLDISKLHESINSLSSENLELKASFQSALEANRSFEEKLFETKKVYEALESENEEMNSALSNISNSLESLTYDFNDVSCERDELQEEVLIVKKQLEMAEALAEKKEAIATEAQEVAESNKVYAEEKEEEVKLLEKSVEELERTVDVLENKVNIIKEEAERQRLQREELEMELSVLKEQTSQVKCVDADMKRHLIEKEKELQEALEHIQILEKEIVVKDAEISQCKAHISELNLQAEAQAHDYKQKFQALESMVEQVKSEGPSSHGTVSSSNKLERNGSKPRGSGSPFKCIGLGLSQQIKSEKDEELAASRLRIEELEALSANRQKEIFMLNARLAATGSMTHDLLRELSGLKLDITKYSYLLDNELLEKITEKPGVEKCESQVKDQDVIKLKQQLNEFIEERKGWLEEIDRKQAEMVVAQVALEELHQRERLLSTENEMIKMECANHKRKINELEMEVKKLSGQQNLQQRIHHHAKIKEENNLLKTQNEELSVRIRRAESSLARIKEVARSQLANGRSPDINFEEENRLRQLLKETEKERLQLAQKLYGLCTSISKVAGVTRQASEISVSSAEEALDQIKHRITSLERELHDVKLKNRISSEKIRLSELMPKLSPMIPLADENRPVYRSPHSPFLSSLDR